MNGPARLLFASAILMSAANTSWGQVNLQPTPAPVVTAEHETWYQSGEPVAFSGHLYYPAGPAIHFLANEMVRSGFYRGVPLYSRTTIEPYSVVFVPVGRGMMQPYERRRDGDLAGTTGSAPPALPSSAGATAPTSMAIPQAAAPPVLAAPVLADEPAAAPSAPAASARTAPSSPRAAGTPGRATSASRRPTRVRPGAANGIYVEFDNARWFSIGPPVSLDVRTLTRIGDSHGFPVYAARRGDSTIYVPIAQGVDTFVPYAKRR
jgi:hypothetical protein